MILERNYRSLMSIKRVLAKVRKADEAYHLINDGDYIAVGLSGGKDSALLLYTLYLYRFLARSTFNKDFKIIGIHIDLHFGEEDFRPQEAFFKKYDIPLYQEKSLIADILKRHSSDGRIECSLCSTLKKGAVIKAAKKCSCNKVAFGHHADDAIETLFMNMIYGGRLATFDPIMHLKREDMLFIRPFIWTFEKEIKKAVHDLNIPAIASGCPNDGHTSRQEIKELLHQLYHQYPQAKENFLLALKNNDKVNLFKPLTLDDSLRDIKDIDKHK